MLVRFWRLARDPNTTLPILATLVGAGMVVAGWLIAGRSYVPGLLQQFGSALVMLMPLLFLGRMLEARMRRTEEQTRSISSDLAQVRTEVSATAAMIDALSATSRDDIERLGERRDEAFAAADRSPTQRAVARVLAEADSVSAIAPRGVRVKVRASGARLRVRAPRSPGEAASLPVGLERADGQPIDTLDWRAGENEADLAGRIAAALVVDADALLGGWAGALVDTLRTAVAAQTGRLPVELGPVVEMPNDQWVISTDGLHCMERPYHIPLARLLDRREDWPRHMRTKSWVAHGKFVEAYDLALALVNNGRH
ncbi:hypothetical protein [Micromonospora foliorum]|uniref:hypothetical protein n=1 Tax=Micromonospora foliorum TaxID=2911210 RepID=UPI001EE982B8|nr:hypothetical protein [Micromonospora foliorum]MCG5435241.1 hypothetical protein [Micromonospora foliorum]